MLSDLVVASAHRSAEASVRSIGMSIARVVCPVHLQLLSFPAYRGAGSRLNPGSSRGITVVEAGLLPSPSPVALLMRQRKGGSELCSGRMRSAQLPLKDASCATAVRAFCGGMRRTLYAC